MAWFPRKWRFVGLGLLALATQRTPAGAWDYKNEPDIFDILRATMRDRGSNLENLLLDFAVARAFVGSRSDGGHLGDVTRFGDAGRVRFEWAVPFASLPRRLAPLARAIARRDSRSMRRSPTCKIRSAPWSTARRPSASTRASSSPKAKGLVR